MAKWPYNTKAWQTLRLAKLTDQPLCEHCSKRGRLVPANVVDHIVAISKGGAAFPSLDKLASLCTRCHNEKTNAIDRPDRARSGRAIKGFDQYGNPLEVTDDWYR